MSPTTHTALHLVSHRIAALESVQSDTAGLEALQVVRQLENIFFRLINNFTLNITKGFSDFKRTELRAYQESHRGDMRQLFSGRTHWINLRPVPIPVPKSLHRPYLVTAEHIDDLLKDACYTDALQQMTQVFTTAVATADGADLATLKTATISLYALWGTQGYVPDKSQLMPYFDMSERGQIEIPTQDVFSELADIEKTSATITRYELYFTQTIQSQKTLKGLETLVDSLVSKLEHRGDVSREYVVGLHDLVSVFATFLDSYAAYLQAAQALEHCFVLALKELVKIR